MPKHQPVPIYFPKGVPDVLKEIARETGYHEQYTALTLWQMQRQLAVNIIRREGKLEPEHFLVPLYSQVLKEKIRDLAGYAKHLAALEKHRVIEMKVQYDARLGKSRQYSYTSRFDPLGKYDRYVLDKASVLNAFHRHKPDPDEPYFKARQCYLLEFDLDFEKAMQWTLEEAGNRTEDSHLFLASVTHELEQIAAGNRKLSKDDFSGREHHPFLWIPSHIRKNFITHSGAPLIQLDLPSAQPLLLFAALNQRTQHKELDKMKEALQLDFYLYMADAWHRHFYTPTPPRKWTKNQFWRFFFGPTRPDLELFQLFRHEFPALYKALASLKRRMRSNEKKPYSILSKVLQQTESDLIFSVCRKLTDEELIPFFTVHDCISVLPAHAERVEQHILEELRQRGIDWIDTLR